MGAAGHAVYMTYSSYCSLTPLAVGQTIMNAKAVSDKTARKIVVRRNGVGISSGSYYIGGETLTVSVATFSLSAFEVVIEAKGSRYYLLFVLFSNYVVFIVRSIVYGWCFMHCWWTK